MVEKSMKPSESTSAGGVKSMVWQPFSDKAVLSGPGGLSLVARDSYTKEFDLTTSGLMQAPKDLSSLVTLKIEERLLPFLFSKFNWSSLFKESNEIINAIVDTFYRSLACSAVLRSHNRVTFSVPLNTAKFFVDLCIQ
jgi:hypothetical protein